MTEESEKPAALVRLETLIACADRRHERAQQRLERAQREVRDAHADVMRTNLDRQQWLEANPPAQHELKV
jgi:hypothetical protein